MSLRDQVRIGRRFQRSVRIDSDIDDAAALEGFICPRTSQDILMAMTRHIGQAKHTAFTWTGPYGSGKSSLAVALCAAVSADSKLRDRASKIFGKPLASALAATMPAKTKGWRVLPAVGRRAPLAHILGEAIEASGMRSGFERPWTDEKVLKAISHLSQHQPNVYGGLLIVDRKSVV